MSTEINNSSLKIDRAAQAKLFGGAIKESFWAKNWSLLYFVLAAFAVIAIGLSLHSSHNNLYKYNQVIGYTKNRIRIIHLAGELSSAAQKVNAPGNDIFDSKNAPQEKERFAKAKANYAKKLSDLQALINSNTFVLSTLVRQRQCIKIRYV